MCKGVDVFSFLKLLGLGGRVPAKEPDKRVMFGSNCPILERTADGDRAGRCWYHCPGDVCPRHGDVAKALARFREDGSLTDEWLLGEDR